jgi:tetratricopeptide (TPR) repeat protein
LCLPLLVMGSVFLNSNYRYKVQSYVRLWPLWLIAAGYIGLRMAYSSHGEGEAAQVAPYAPDYAIFTTLLEYLRMLIWPTDLHMGHELPNYPTLWHAKVIGGVALGLLTMAQILRRQSPRSLPFSWGLCWFFAALLPCLLVTRIFYEHWLYLPSAGLFLGVAQSLAVQSKKLPPLLARHIALGGMLTGLGAVLLAGGLTYRQNMIWHDPMVFYAHIFAQGEPAAKAHVNLGVLYAQQGEYEKAIAQYQIAIRNSDDKLAEAQSNWAATLRLMPDSVDYAGTIIQHFERALAIDANFYPAIDGLAQFYSERGDTANAARYQARVEALRVRFHAE